MAVAFCSTVEQEPLLPLEKLFLGGQVWVQHDHVGVHQDLVV